MSCRSWRTKLDTARGHQAELVLQRDSALDRQQDAEHRELDAEKALAETHIVAKATQSLLEYRVSELVSLAMEGVMPNPYALRLIFEVRRSQTEADLWFERDGELIDPYSSTGGGAVDVAAFGLRCSLWSLMRPRSRKSFILDEPFQHLKGADANRRAIQVVKHVAESLGLQFIIVSDERAAREDIVDGADRVFLFSKPKTKSKMEVITNEPSVTNEERRKKAGGPNHRVRSPRSLARGGRKPGVDGGNGASKSGGGDALPVQRRIIRRPKK
jgi:hypothetical protein